MIGRAMINISRTQRTVLKISALAITLWDWGSVFLELASGIGNALFCWYSIRHSRFCYLSLDEANGNELL